MKLTGPEASAPIEATRAPLGLSVEKSWPMPPPCCIVSAASLTPSKIAPRSSSISPKTKQLNSVTSRPVPAPARMRPAGRKPRSAMASWKRCAQRSRTRLPPFSGAAAARATRQNVSSAVASMGVPSSPLKRYLRSQISAEIGAGNSNSVGIFGVLLGRAIWARNCQKSINVRHSFSICSNDVRMRVRWPRRSSLALINGFKFGRCLRVPIAWDRS